MVDEVMDGDGRQGDHAGAAPGTGRRAPPGGAVAGWGLVARCSAAHLLDNDYGVPRAFLHLMPAPR